MTIEEAIKKLQKQKAEYLDEWVDYSGIAEAFDMAIKALKAFGCTGCEHYDQEETAMICKECRRYYKDKHSLYDPLSTDEPKKETPNHFSNACDLCVHKNIMCNICMTADKWEPKLNSSKSNSEDIQ